MIYKATVLDNTEFFSKGTIRVRAPYFYDKIIDYEYKDNPSVLGEGKYTDEFGEQHKDINAIVFASFGGGRGFGSFVLPQVNEEGFIFFPEENVYGTAVWLGSFFSPKKDATSGNIEYVNIPSDKADEDATDGIVDGSSNMDEDISELLKKNIVIRTKNTEYSESDGTALDWEQKPTSNLIVVDNKQIKVRHFNSETGWENNVSNQYSDITINDDGIRLEYTDNSNSIGNFIDVTKDGISISTVESENVISIDKDNNIVIKTPNKVIFEEATAIEMLGDGDYLVKYKDLYDILTIFSDHVHVDPNGISGGPLTGNLAPILSQIKTLLMNMQADKIKTE